MNLNNGSDNMYKLFIDSSNKELESSEWWVSWILRDDQKILKEIFILLKLQYVDDIEVAFCNIGIYKDGMLPR